MVCQNVEEPGLIRVTSRTVILIYAQYEWKIQFLCWLIGLNHTFRNKASGQCLYSHHCHPKVLSVCIDDYQIKKTFSALLALYEGNSLVTGGFPAQRSVARIFYVSLICAWTKGWANTRDTGDLRRPRAQYDVAAMHEVHTIHPKKYTQIYRFSFLFCTFTQISHGEFTGFGATIMLRQRRNPG